MIPNVEQSFIIGILFGSSFVSGETIEIWGREEYKIKNFEKIFKDNEIPYYKKEEGIRDLIIIESLKDIEKFLNKLEIKIENFDPKKIKKIPEWFCDFSEKNENICASFLLGIFESAGICNLLKNKKLKIFIPNSDMDFANKILDFVNYFKNKNKKYLKEDVVCLVFDQQISGSKYSVIHILAEIFLEIMIETPSLKYSKINEQVNFIKNNIENK